MGFFKKLRRKAKKAFKKVKRKVKKVSKKFSIKNIKKVALKYALPVAKFVPGLSVVANGVSKFNMLRSAFGKASRGAISKSSLGRSVQRFQKRNPNFDLKTALEDNVNRSNGSIVHTMNRPTYMGYQAQKTNSIAPRRMWTVNSSGKSTPLGAGQGVYTNKGWEQKQQAEKSNDNIKKIGIGAAFALLLLPKLRKQLLNF